MKAYLVDFTQIKFCLNIVRSKLIGKKKNVYINVTYLHYIYIIFLSFKKSLDFFIVYNSNAI